MTHRTFRSLLLERDPEKLAAEPLESIRDAGFTHQAAAMAAGYNSVAEMAIDDLVRMVRDLLERVERLEEDTPPGFEELER